MEKERIGSIIDQLEQRFVFDYHTEADRLARDRQYEAAARYVMRAEMAELVLSHARQELAGIGPGE